MVDGFNFTSVGATNTVIVRVMDNNTVFGEGLALSAYLSVYDENAAPVNLSTIAVIDGNGKNTYSLQVNWTIRISTGGSLSLQGARVQLTAGIAHRSDIPASVVQIGNVIQSIMDPLNITSDVVTNQMLWNFVPKLRPTVNQFRALSIRIKVTVPGEFPTIKLDYGNGNVNTYTYEETGIQGAFLSSIQGQYVLLKYDGTVTVDERDDEYKIYLVNSNFVVDGVNVNNKLERIQLVTSGNTLTSFDISEIGVTSILGSERMVLESSLLQLEDKGDYSNVTRARLDALYQYFKQHDSSIHPSTGAAQ